MKRTMKRTMKSAAIFAMGMALAFSAMACGKKEIVIHEGDNPSSAEGIGGGTIQEAEEITLPEGAKEAYEKAMETYTEKEFIPVGYLGSQVVAGTNYKFLCSTVPSENDPLGVLHVVVVYQDLDGKAEVTSAEMVDISQYLGEGKAFAPEELMGGWMTADAFGAGLDGELKDLFAAADAEYKNIALEPIAPLDVAMGSSMSYAILCKGTADSKTGLCVALFVQDLKSGKTSIDHVNAFEY